MIPLARVSAIIRISDRQGRLLQRVCLRPRSVEMQHLDARPPLHHPVRPVSGDHFVDCRIDMRSVGMNRITRPARPHRLVLVERQVDPRVAQGMSALTRQHDRFRGAAPSSRKDVSLVRCDAIKPPEVIARVHGSARPRRMISAQLNTARLEPGGGHTVRRSWERLALTSSRR